MKLQPGVDYIGIGVGAVIINKEGKIFLALRGKKARNEHGKWECPGGTLRFGENPMSAVKREIKEEYGITIDLFDELTPFNHVLRKEKQHWVGLCFIGKIISGIPVIREPKKCDKIGWFSLLEMEKLPLTQYTKYRLKQVKDKFSDDIIRPLR